MYIGTSPVNFQEIDRSIEGILKDIPPQLLNHLKRNFEQNISSFIGGSFKLELRLVVDSSSVISNLISFAKRRESILHKLVKEPFLRLYAPSTLKKEVERNIAEISKKKKLDVELLMKTWRTEILPKITVLNTSDFKAMFKGFLAVGTRDKTDVPFVALHFQLGTHGVITKDKDIIEQPLVRTWRLRRVGGLITVFKKGAFSFFIYSKVLPNVLYAVFKIAVAVLRIAFEMLAKIIRFIINLASGVVRAISGLPDWAQLLVGIAAIILILEDRTRNLAVEFLKRVSEAIFEFASEVYTAIKNLLEYLAPLVQIALTVLTYLFNSYQETIKQLRAL